MASCICGHSEIRHPTGSCLDCTKGECNKYVKMAFAPSTAASTKKARQTVPAAPATPTAAAMLSSVKDDAPPPEVVHGDIMSAANGVNDTPVVAPPPPPLTDGPAGGNFVLAYPTTWKPERLDFYVRGDITFNLGQLGEYLAISAIGEIFWRGQRLGRNAELRRRIVSWLGNTAPDDQPPIKAIEGGLNLNASHGMLPFRTGCRRGAPGKIVFMGSGEKPAMTITEEGFFLAETQVPPTVIINALLEYFDDAEPEGNGVSTDPPLA